MERTQDSGLIEPHYFGHCNRGHRRKATRLAGQAALTKEVPLVVQSDHGFLALLGNHGDLALAVYDVKDSICRISLAEDYFILSIFRFGPSPVCVGEERLKNKGLLPLSFYGHGSALDTCRVRV
jgi:hypothetical protein